MANGEAGSGPFWGKEEWRGEEGYYKMLASSFADLLASCELASFVFSIFSSLFRISTYSIITRKPARC